ncbi:MAG: SIMPL domain-containing protein [Stellaceae bacterium]
MPRLTVVFAAALLSLCVPALAAEAPGDGATLLHLSEEAQRPVARDQLRAVLRVEGSDSDAARLQAEIDRRMAAAVARAKSVAGVSLFTAGDAVYEQHAKDQPAQWHGSAGLSLTARDAAPLLSLVGELQQSGLLMSALAYELTPEAARKAEDALTAEALDRLRQRAERVAGDLGLAVLRLRDLRVGNANGAQPLPRLFAAAASAAPAPVAEPGEATVSVSVDAEFELGQKR